MAISLRMRRTRQALISALTAMAVVGSVLIAAPTTAGAAAGDVSAWGVNSLGQLGDGTTAYRTNAVSSGADSTIDIAGGRHHVVAARTDGTVTSWGWNGTGQIGNGNFTNQPSPCLLYTSDAADE